MVAFISVREHETPSDPSVGGLGIEVENLLPAAVGFGLDLLNPHHHIPILLEDADH
jgi:hypothetical protein